MRKEYALLPVAILLLASGHPVGKIILEQVDSIQLGMISTVLSSIVFWIALVATRGTVELRRYSRNDLYLALAAGLLYFTLYPLMTFSALALIPPAINALLVGTSPIVVTVISATITDERLKKLGYLGIGLGFVGVFVVLFGSGIGTAASEGLLTFGPIYSIAGACFSATYTIIGRRLMQRHGSLPTMGIASALGATSLVVLAAGSVGFGALLTASTTVKLLILYWGIFSGVGALLYFYCLKNLAAPRVASFAYLSPAFAAILSFVILAEPITISLVVGLVLVFIAIRLAQR
jgi:drug/metabolite transporter (DMT)-like permease